MAGPLAESASAADATPPDTSADEERARHLPMILVIAAAVVAADQLTKWLAVSRLESGDPVEIIWTLQFNLVTNTGAAFSTGSGLGPWIGVAALVVVALAIFWSG